MKQSRPGRELKVLFLSELFFPHGGGAELATYLYAKLLSQLGMNIVVVTNKFGQEETVTSKEGMVIYRLPSLTRPTSVKYSVMGRVDITLSASVRKLVKWADIVYIPRFWYTAIVLSKALGKPVVTHLHDYILVCPLSNLFETTKGVVCPDRTKLFCSPSCICTYERNRRRNTFQTLASVFLNATIVSNLKRLIGMSDAIICVSKAQRDLIVSRVPGLIPKIYTIYNPIPEVPYTEIEGDDFGYFGGPQFLKGFHVLQKALVYTKDKRIKVQATNLDTGNALLGVCNPHFTFHKRLDALDFERIWRLTRAVVVPSIWHEPLPYVVSEALLRGRLFLASKVGGIPEQTQGCDGIFFEAGNCRGLAEGLDLVRGLDREQVTELGFRNREEFLRRFDNEDTIHKFINVCESLM